MSGPRNQWNPYPAATVKAMAALYAKGKSLSQIARLYELTPGSIRGILDRNGIRFRARGVGVAMAWKEGRIKRRLPTGDAHHNWKGGRPLADGYRLVKHQRGRRPYLPEHRLVMEAHLGRRLKSSEIVHHINGIKTDNRLANLEITTRSEHARHHTTQRHAQKA